MAGRSGVSRRHRRAAGNPVIAKVIRDLHMRTCIFDHRVVPERFIRGCEEHLAMLEALRQGAAEDGAALMAAHLDHARDAIFDHLPQAGAAGAVEPRSTEQRGAIKP